MNNEALLKRLIEIKNSLPEDEQAMINNYIDTNYRIGKVENTIARLVNLILDVKEAMEMDYAKKNGTSEKLKCAKNILKRAASSREILKYAYTDKSGIQTICNSYCMVRLTEPLNLPELPAKMEYVNVKRIMPKQKKPVTLELPSVADLKTYIALKKAEKMKGIAYSFGENLPKVDATVLLDVMTLVPHAVATYEFPMVVFNNDKGDYALLCVLRSE